MFSGKTTEGTCVSCLNSTQGAEHSVHVPSNVHIHLTECSACLLHTALFCAAAVDGPNRVLDRPQWTGASDRSPSGLFMANYTNAGKQ